MICSKKLYIRSNGVILGRGKVKKKLTRRIKKIMNFVSSKHQTVTLSASDVVAGGQVARFANIFCMKLNAFL